MTPKIKVVRAFGHFIKKERYLLSVEANERSLTHRLAIYIEKEFPDFNVDCEYNRNGMEPKRLDSFKRQVDSDDIQGVTVYPDIIVHRRGPGNNLVVIEAKTSKNQQACQNNGNCHCDRCKLRAYKKDIGYQHAFFVIFPVGDDLQDYSENHIDKYLSEIDEDTAEPTPAADKVREYL